MDINPKYVVLVTRPWLPYRTAASGGAAVAQHSTVVTIRLDPNGCCRVTVIITFRIIGPEEERGRRLGLKVCAVAARHHKARRTPCGGKTKQVPVLIRYV